MKIAIVVVCLAGLASYCLAAPLPSPSPFFGLEKAPSSRVSSSQAIKNHNKILTEAKAMINDISVKKLHSIHEADLLKQKQLPIYHGEKIEIAGKYNNAAYKDSVDDLKRYADDVGKMQKKLARHVEALARKKMDPVDRARAKEANEMLHGLIGLHPMLKHHIEEEGAKEKIERIKNGPARFSAGPIRQPVKHFEEDMKAITDHLVSLPNVKQPARSSSFMSNLNLPKSFRRWKKKVGERTAEVKEANAASNETGETSEVAEESMTSEAED